MGLLAIGARGCAAIGESHIVIADNYDPLTMGSLKASQVQVMYEDTEGRIIARPPDVDPRGLGFTKHTDPDFRITNNSRS